MARVPVGPLERDPRSDKEDGAERGAGVPTSVAGAADDRRDASVRNEATARPTSAAPTAAPPLSLEALREQPRATPVDTPPVPRTLRDRGVRQLVDPASGTIEVISAWGDTLSREREAELWVLVDTAGKVHEVYLSRSSGLPSLDDVAVGAVTNVIYAPARRGAGPVPAWVRQRVAFKLE